MPPIVFKETIAHQNAGAACDYLAERTGLSKSQIKKAMNCGAAWVKRSRKKERRIRRATKKLKPGDSIALYYNEKILSQVPPPAKLVLDESDYSVWYKPAGLMTQGARFGDHCSLEFFVKRYFQPPRVVFLVHRIDREASGLVLLAHYQKAAAALSKIWRQKEVKKFYQVWVRGNLHEENPQGRVEQPLDGREALTLYDTIRYDAKENKTLVRVELITGRRHQIRRHFNTIGFPVMGDPVYGKGNKNQQGLQLIACELDFTCPIKGRHQRISIDPQKEMKWD